MIKKASGPIVISSIEDIHFDSKIDVLCPICKNNNTIDFSKSGINHPSPSGEAEVSFWCCGTLFELPITLKSVIVSVHYDTRDLIKVDSRTDE